MKEMLFALGASIMTIFITWIFNLFTTKRQHKMEMQRLAVQNKLEVSKTAIGWLMEVKNELFVLIWCLEHYTELDSNMWSSTIERSKKLIVLGAEAKNNFNAIELYYDLDDIAKKYNLWVMISKMLTLENVVATLNNNPQYSVDEYKKEINELLTLLISLHSAIADITERIRQDILNYLK